MPKWVEKAKKAMAGKQISSFDSGSLEETLEQASRIIDDIRFIIECSGQKLATDEISVELIDEVEAFYRERTKSMTDEPTPVGADNFERLLAVLLGQWIVEDKGGVWIVYEGKNHVYCPVVVKLPSGRHLDVFLFCKQLNRKGGVSGVSSGTSLTTFANRAESMGFL